MLSLQLKALVVAVVVATASLTIRAASELDVNAIAKADALIEQGRAAAIRAVERKDKKARSEARDSFEEAHKLMKRAIDRAAACERCHELLAAAAFGLGYIGEDENYEDILETTERSLQRFPGNGRVSLYRGSAHYYRKEHSEAARVLKRYLASPSRDADTDAMVDTMLKVSHESFLNGWYNQRDFYQSDESRITRLNTQTFKKELVFQVTPDYELQLGQMGFNSVSKAGPDRGDAEATQFLQQLVERLTAKTPGPGFRYQVRVIDSPEINAVTPPGHILVFTGLLRFVDTEAQLAGVLAHELAHNYGHHSARQVIKSYHAAQITSAITQAINPQTATSQLIAQLVGKLGVELFLRAYSRFEEKEADLYGTHLMFNAGYHPTAMPAFHLKMYENKPRQPIKFLSTHPPMPDRVNYVMDYLETFPLDGHLVVDSSDAFKRLKAKYPSVQR